MKRKNINKVGLSLLIAIMFIVPAGTIMAEESSEAGVKTNDDMAVRVPSGVYSQVAGDVGITGVIMEPTDGGDPFVLVDGATIPFAECYTIYANIFNEDNGLGLPGEIAQIKPHLELYSVTEGIDVILYETSFEDNFDIYNNWVQIDEDCGMGGYYDSWSWSDSRASDGDHSMKSTMYDIYKGNQDDILLCNRTFNASGQYAFRVEFDVWVEGQYDYYPTGGQYAYMPYDFVAFEISDSTDAAMDMWYNPDNYLSSSHPGCNGLAMDEVLDPDGNVIQAFDGMLFKDGNFYYDLCGAYYFMDTAEIDIYSPDQYSNYTPKAERIDGDWWHVWYEITVEDLETFGFDIENMMVRFVWQTDPQFQYEGGYIDNFKVISVEDVQTKIFQTHSQGPVDWPVCEAAFEFPLDWCCNLAEGCYYMRVWVEVLSAGHQSLNDWPQTVNISFCVGDEIDCEITTLIVEDSFNPGDIILDGGRAEEGSDAHIIFYFHNNGNVPVENVPVKLTVEKMAREVIYEDDFEGMVWSDTASFGVYYDLNPNNLWHKTSVDSWSGSNSLGWFNKDTLHYEDDIYINYVMGPSVDMEDVEEMQMDYYAKWITRDANDYWNFIFSDPATNYVLGCGGGVDGWGYQPTWVGPDQPQGKYNPFNIKLYYDYWQQVRGMFRYPDGSKSYTVGIGFVAWETDSYGYINAQAESNYEFWSGLFVDDPVITSWGPVEEVFTDTMIIPGPVEPCDYVRAQFEWEDVPFSNYRITVSTECEGDIEEDNDEMHQTILVLDNCEKMTEKEAESMDLTGLGEGEWGICGSDYDNYLSTNPDSEWYESYANSIVMLCPDHSGECDLEDCAINVTHLSVLELEFDTWFDLEYDFDFVFFEIAEVTRTWDPLLHEWEFDPLVESDWQVIDVFNDYSGSWWFFPDDDGWVNGYTINLDDYVDGTIADYDFMSMRFRIVSDGGWEFRGMLIDDLFIEDLFNVTEVTDPVPVYEDLEDPMDNMSNWCTTIMHYGQYWENITETQFCNSWSEYPVNDALVWETEIVDAYEAWLSFDYIYDFEDPVDIIPITVPGTFDTTGLPTNNWDDTGGSLFVAGLLNNSHVATYGYPGLNAWDLTGYGQMYMTCALDSWNYFGLNTYAVDIYSGFTPEYFEFRAFEWSADTNNPTGGFGANNPEFFISDLFNPSSFHDPAHVWIRISAISLGIPAGAYPWYYFGYANFLSMSLNCTESGFVEISADGGENWFVLDHLTGHGAGEGNYDISGYAGNDLLIRFRAFGEQELQAYGPGFLNVAQGGDWCIDNVSITCKTDNTAPTTSISMTGTMTDAGWYSSSVQCKITAVDDHAMGEIHYILDGVETVVAGDVAQFTVSGNGAHNIEFWGVDATGNEETPHNIVPTFRIDSGSPPSIAITAPEPGLYLFGNNLLSLSKVFIIGAFTTEATASDAESGVYRVSFYLDGDLISEDTEAPYSAYCAIKHMGEGTIKAVAEDFSGNTAEDTLDITYYKFL